MKVKKKKKDFFFLNWENIDGIGKKMAILDWEFRNSAPREGQKMPCIVTYQSFLDLTKHLV